MYPNGRNPEAYLRFVQLDPFPRQWDRLKLSGDCLRVLEIDILADPKFGTVVPGTGGLRKLRFSAPGSGKGKSSSYRVYYLYLEEYGQVLLWAILDKTERSDLSKSDRNAIAKEVERLKRLLERGDIR